MAADYAARSMPERLSRRFVVHATRIRADILFAVLDATFVVAAFGVILFLRFDGNVPDHYGEQWLALVPLLAVLTLVVNWAWGLYGQLWRHAGVLEARRILLAALTMATVMAVAMTVGSRLLPLSVVILGFMLYAVLAGAVRFQSRLFARNRDHSQRPGLRVVVLGAGETGAGLIRDMFRSPRAGLIPIAVLDDDPRTHGRHLMGIPVVGAIDELPRVADTTLVHHAVLAVSDSPPDLVRRAADLADQADIPLRVIRGVADVVKGHITLGDVRDLQIEDLLGREQVVTDLDAVRRLLVGRRVLVTGAGGSIGSEVARQVYAADPALLLALDHDETHLHVLCSGLRTGPVDDERVVPLLADIRDADVIRRLFVRYRPEVVFHAAAHKHVPVLEQHPAEAIRTNVAGTLNVLDAAEAVNVERFVFISTDKAVNPSCVMGASKNLGERLVLARSGPGRHYCAVRFGNVLGSRGSVIPTFMQQLNNGGPITVTDPRMTRFFMSIREAVQLVLQAATISSGRDVFVLEMGEQVRIVDLARRMIRLAGRRVGDDVEIRVTGVRPGEKLSEELHAVDEELRPTAHPAIRRIGPAVSTAEALRRAVEPVIAAADSGDDDALRHELYRLVNAAPAGGDSQPSDVGMAVVGAGADTPPTESTGESWQ